MRGLQLTKPQLQPTNRMKKSFVAALFAATLLLPTPISFAADAPNAVQTELNELVAKINDKIRQGKRSEEALSDELKEFEALAAKHKETKSEEVAQIHFMQATLYLQVLENQEKGTELLKQLKSDFPGTQAAERVDQVLAWVEKQAAVKKIQASLVRGAQFPDFKEEDIEGKPLSIANYKGKVVLVDFWATWCGPCVAELPNVLKAYEKYHDKGFDIVGISLDRDESALRKFIEEHKMPWAQYFDGKGWDSDLAGRYGVNAIPMTFLLDREGKIIGKDLRGPALEEAVAGALAQAKE